MIIIIWQEYAAGSHALHCQRFDDTAKAARFAHDVDDGIDHARRDGREVVYIFEGARELYRHAASMDASELLDYPPNDE